VWKWSSWRVRIRALPPSATTYQVVSCVLMGNPYLKAGMRRKHCSGISQNSGSHFWRNLAAQASR
jgi:hypothetical protein